MLVAPLPANENERLADLRGLGILETPIEERFDRITRLVCRSLDVPISAVSLVEDDRQWFKSIQGLPVCETSRDVAFCAHAILNDEPFIVEDALLDPRFAENPLVTDDPKIRFYAGIPLSLGNGRNIGTLCAIDRVARTLSDDDIQTLRDLADMVTAELNTIAANETCVKLCAELEQAERAALIDPLTRVWNRRGAMTILEREVQRAERGQTPLTCALVDIDHFKRVNDEHGHDLGDEVLRQFAKTALSALRSTDILSRWGGEEFLILLPECSEPDAQIVLHRMLKKIRDLEFEGERNPFRITASIGMAAFADQQIEPIEAVLKEADRRLYAAKENGRDCIIAQGEHDAFANGALRAG